MAGVHDDNPVGIFAGEREIVGDQDCRHPGGGGELGKQIHHHRLGRDVETGGRLVGDQQGRRAGERQGDCHTLAHPARQLEGVGGSAARRIWDADLGQHLDGPRRRLRPGDAAMPNQHVFELFADRPDRVQRAARVLRDQREFASPHFLERALTGAKQIRGRQR